MNDTVWIVFREQCEYHDVLINGVFSEESEARRFARGLFKEVDWSNEPESWDEVYYTDEHGTETTVYIEEMPVESKSCF